MINTERERERVRERKRERKNTKRESNDKLDRIRHERELSYHL